MSYPLLAVVMLLFVVFAVCSVVQRDSICLLKELRELQLPDNPKLIKKITVLRYAQTLIFIAVVLIAILTTPAERPAKNQPPTKITKK